ncbi:MAG TPA: ABC transporter substrate-binding protein, partial [Candidatus Binataceae bacterium]|nr:ABC transporter substrate-binding protein [Candidatus Binataceae bacterium]
MKSQRAKVIPFARPAAKSKVRPAHKPPLSLVPARPPARKRGSSRRTMTILYAVLIAAAAIVIAMLYAAAPVHADTPPPTDPMKTVQHVMDQTIAVFQEKDIAAPDRRRKLRTIAEAHFDFEDMAKSAVGYHWRDLTPDQRDEFVPLFTTFLEDVALTQIEKYSIQRVQHDIQASVIAFDRERVDGNRAEVFSTVTMQNSSDPIQMSYLMKNDGGDWRIYDIDVDSISVIANYRNQFNRVMNQHGYDRLMELLREKSNQLGSQLAN